MREEPLSEFTRLIGLLHIKVSYFGLVDSRFPYILPVQYNCDQIGTCASKTMARQIIAAEKNQPHNRLARASSARVPSPESLIRRRAALRGALKLHRATVALCQFTAVGIPY